MEVKPKRLDVLRSRSTNRKGAVSMKPPPLQLREKSQACYLTIGVKV